MIKNNRPYTIENGCVDSSLITGHSETEINEVSEWIRGNIRPAKRVLSGKTSYGLKHLLERDTDIYLTNNEFKDAMMLAGYMPVNPNELNWRYKISLTSEENYNESPFFKWAIANFIDEQSPVGDFVRDMANDFEFPVLSEKGIIINYLFRVGACNGAVDAFEELWRLYERETSRT